MSVPEDGDSVYGLTEYVSGREGSISDFYGPLFLPHFDCFASYFELKLICDLL